MSIVGVDPGLGGAVVVLSHAGDIRFYSAFQKLDKRLDIPHTINLFKEIKKKYKPSRLFLEKVHAMPNQGVSSMFNFGVTFGHLEMVIASTKIPYELITPRVWTSYMHKGMDKNIEAKKRSQQLAQSLYPDHSLTLTERAKKPHDGVVDALLLAEYGRLKMLGAV